MRYTTVIFDLDGTLLDTIDDIRTSINMGLEKYGYSKHTREEIINAIGNGSAFLVNRLIPGGGENPDAEKVLAFHRSFYPENCDVLTKPFDGITELLKYLSEREYKLAVASNKPDNATKQLVKNHFGSMISVAVGEQPTMQRKPAPDMAFFAMRELGSVPEECVYVGDSEVDIETAKNAGMKCISVSWGYRKRELLLQSGAEAITDRPEDIKRFV